METIHKSSEFDIQLHAGCSTADANKLPKGTRACSCYAIRINKTPEQRDSILSSAVKTGCCGKYPTTILITRHTGTLADQDRRNEHKATIIPKINEALAERMIGKKHEEHYQQSEEFLNNVIKIQLKRVFKSDESTGNTTDEK